MGQGNAPFGHHLDQGTGAELEGQVPPHAEHDDLLVKVPPLEKILRPTPVRSSRALRRVTGLCKRLHQNRPEYVLLLAGAADASCREQQNEFAGASRIESSVALI